MFNNPNTNPNTNPFQFSFGNTSANTAPTTTDFSFGAPATNPSPFSSFGNTTPATSSSFSFGGFSQPSTSSFSFGDTSAPTSQFSFGSPTAPTASFGSFGSFGQSTDATSGSAFSFSAPTPSSTTSAVFPSPSAATPSSVASTPSTWGYGGFTSPTIGDPLATQKFTPEPELNLTDSRTVYFQSITKQPQFQGYSFEELRNEYMNRQHSQDLMAVNSGAVTTLFGAPSTGASFSTGFEFGAPSAKSEPSFGSFAATTPSFGTTAPAAGFGSAATTAPISFGSFDTSATSFGAGQPAAAPSFGTSWLSQPQPQQQPQQQPSFGFTLGAAQPTPAPSAFSFGDTTSQVQQQPSFGFSFGATPSAATTPSVAQPTPAPSPFVFGAAPATPAQAPAAFVTSTAAPVAMTGTVSLGQQPQATFAFDFPTTAAPTTVSNQELQFVMNHPYGGSLQEIEELATTKVNVDTSTTAILPTFESTWLPPKQPMLPATFHGMLRRPKRKRATQQPLSKRLLMFEPSDEKGQEELLWTTENPSVKTLTIYNPEVITPPEEIQPMVLKKSPNASPQKATVTVTEPQREKSPEPALQEDATGQFAFAPASTSSAPVFHPTENYEGLPICTREDYSTIPSMEAILKMPTVDRRHISNFTIIRQNHGEITFLGETNVVGLNIDKIVQIEKRYVQLYSESLYGALPKPRRGQELNKPAIVTLYNVFPKARQRSERTTRSFEQKLRDAIYQMDGAEFMSYDRETGTWRFKVSHFV